MYLRWRSVFMSFSHVAGFDSIPAARKSSSKNSTESVTESFEMYIFGCSNGMHSKLTMPECICLGSHMWCSRNQGCWSIDFWAVKKGSLEITAVRMYIIVKCINKHNVWFIWFVVALRRLIIKSKCMLIVLAKPYVFCTTRFIYTFELFAFLNELFNLFDVAGKYSIQTSFQYLQFHALIS